MTLHAKSGAVLGVLALGGSGTVFAAGPAVSGPNGKVEFDAGVLNVSSGFSGRAAGTLTLPLGDRYGLQADFSAASAGGPEASAAFHFFTRDPQSYLIGGTLGVIRTPGASVVAAGPEAEGYFGRWTLEAWGGLAVTRPTSGAARAGVFGMADVAYYPDDNFRLSAGLSLLDGYAALHLGAEYLFASPTLPLAVTAEARFGQDGSVQATIGLRAYFGASDKPLILRHREDDPWDRGGSLLGAVGGSTFAAAGTTAGPPAGDGADTGTGNATGSGDTPPACNPLTEATAADGSCVPFL